MENEETRNEKFIRLAENRTNNAINCLRLLGNCANKSNYEYTDEQVEQIFKAIDKAVAEMKSKFNVKKEDTVFRFKRVRPHGGAMAFSS